MSGRGPHISGGSFTFGMAGVNGGGHQGGEGNEQGGEWFVRILFDRPTFSYSHVLVSLTHNVRKSIEHQRSNTGTERSGGAR